LFWHSPDYTVIVIMPDQDRPERRAVQFGLRSIFVATLIVCFGMLYFRSPTVVALVSAVVGLLLVTGAFLAKGERGEPLSHACAFAFGFFLAGVPYALIVLGLETPDAVATADLSLAASACLAVLGMFPFLAVLEVLKKWATPRNTFPTKCVTSSLGVAAGLVVLTCGNTIGTIATVSFVLLTPALLAVAVTCWFRSRRED
jgi:hypothetical protein